MPLFDFHCPHCKETFEALVKTPTEAACPTCGAADLERLASAIAPRMRARSVVRAARKAATREGHFSHYSRSERAKAR